MKKQVFYVLVTVLALASISGCAGLNKGPSDEEIISGKVAIFKQALLEKNLEKLMTVASEKFDHPDVGGKAEAKQFLQLGIDSGYTDGGEVDISKIQIKIEKDTATVYPIEVSSSAGSATAGLTFTKEKVGNGTDWLVTTVEVEGV